MDEVADEPLPCLRLELPWSPLPVQMHELHASSSENCSHLAGGVFSHLPRPTFDCLREADAIVGCAVTDMCSHAVDLTLGAI